MRAPTAVSYLTSGSQLEFHLSIWEYDMLTSQWDYCCKVRLQPKRNQRVLGRTYAF